MKCLLTIRLVDQSDGAIFRLTEHILRAQRLAWFSDGMEHPDAAEVCERIEKAYNPRAMLDLETLGRQMAYERAGPSMDFEHSPGLRYSGDVHDSTIMVNDVSKGSLVLELAIPLTAFVAVYIARLVAEDRQQKRVFEARMRTIDAVVDQLNYKPNSKRRALSAERRERLLTRMIDGIGSFESKIIDSLRLDIAGSTLELGTGKLRGDSKDVDLVRASAGLDENQIQDRAEEHDVR